MKIFQTVSALAFAALFMSNSSAQVSIDPVLDDQNSGSDALFIGISVVDDSSVWISGTGGSFGRTVDGGKTWEIDVVPGADSLQFRDVHAVNAETAFLLSIGNGESSRIYKTENGGENWDLQFTNPEPSGFFDCLGFWDENNGMAFSDSFDGNFFIITTNDGGATWVRVPPERLPAARPGEGSFAASGHCLHTGGDSLGWIGTGAHENGQARVLRTEDRGYSWTYHDTSIPSGEMSGITSVAFVDGLRGAVLGGNVMAMEDSLSENIALSDDGGVSWRSGGRPPFSGPVYGAVYVPESDSPTLVAVGPEGMAVTVDQGESWVLLSEENHWSVAFANPQSGWAIGPEGRVTKIRLF